MLEDDPSTPTTHMMVKTHLSLTHDPTLKGVPKRGRCPSGCLDLLGPSSFARAQDDQPHARNEFQPGFRRVD